MKKVTTDTMTKEEKLAWEERRWKQKKTLILRDYELRKDKAAVRWQFFPKPANSKVLMWFLFINCTLIELFTGYVTLLEFDLARTVTDYSPDLTPLVTLVGTVVSEVLAFAVYCAKSVRENTQGGIVYESAMKEKDTTPPPPTPDEEEAKG